MDNNRGTSALLHRNWAVYDKALIIIVIIGPSKTLQKEKAA